MYPSLPYMSIPLHQRIYGQRSFLCLSYTVHMNVSLCLEGILGPAEKSVWAGWFSEFWPARGFWFRFPWIPIVHEAAIPLLAGSDSESLEFPSGHAGIFGGLSQMSIGTIEISWMRWFFLWGFPLHLSWTRDRMETVLFEGRP